MKKKPAKLLSSFLALLFVFSSLSVASFAATEKSCSGKYGKLITVKSDYKTRCTKYNANGDSAKLYLFF